MSDANSRPDRAGRRPTASAPAAANRSALTAEGATREEALQKLQELVQRGSPAAPELVSLEVPAVDNPWAALVRDLVRDDPLIAEWQADHRRGTAAQVTKTRISL